MLEEEVLSVGEKKRLKVNLRDLVSAMADAPYNLENYLDMETGEIIPIHEDSEFMEEYAEILQAIEDESDRYVYIDKVDSWDAYRDMEDFIATVADDQLKKLLLLAIDGKGAFGRFRNVLREYPEENARWLNIRNWRNLNRALDFLDRIGVEPVE